MRAPRTVASRHIEEQALVLSRDLCPVIVFANAFRCAMSVRVDKPRLMLKLPQRLCQLLRISFEELTGIREDFAVEDIVMRDNTCAAAHRPKQCRVCAADRVPVQISEAVAPELAEE